MNMALDRIQNTEQISGHYLPNTEVDFTTHFEDVIGVSVGPGEPIKVELHVANEEWPYIESKPLHGSQTVLKRGTDGVRISVLVQPNHEFYSLLLSYGAGIAVLGPKEVREAVIRRLEQAVELYPK